MRSRPMEWTLAAAWCVVVGLLVSAIFVSCAPDPGYKEGQYIIRCGLKKTGKFDPIVYPGQRNVSHQHEFYGGNIFPESTYEQLSS